MLDLSVTDDATKSTDDTGWYVSAVSRSVVIRGVSYVAKVIRHGESVFRWSVRIELPAGTQLRASGSCRDLYTAYARVDEIFKVEVLDNAQER